MCSFIQCVLIKSCHEVGTDLITGAQLQTKDKSPFLCGEFSLVRVVDGQRQKQTNTPTSYNIYLVNNCSLVQFQVIFRGRINRIVDKSNVKNEKKGTSRDALDAVHQVWSKQMEGRAAIHTGTIVFVWKRTEVHF